MVQFRHVREYLQIETVFCRLLTRVARMYMDWNLKKLGQRFKFYAKITIEIIMVICAAWWNLFDIFFVALRGALCQWVLAPSYDLAVSSSVLCGPPTWPTWFRPSDRVFPFFFPLSFCTVSFFLLLRLFYFLLVSPWNNLFNIFN